MPEVVVVIVFLLGYIFLLVFVRFETIVNLLFGSKSGVVCFERRLF